jgi:hypothetical protein
MAYTVLQARLLGAQVFAKNQFARDIFYISLELCRVFDTFGIFPSIYGIFPPGSNDKTFAPAGEVLIHDVGYA